METRIRELREAQGLTRAELSQLAHVGYQALAKWEAGSNEISLAMAAKIARALGVKVSDLLCGSPKRDDRMDELARAYRSLDDAWRDALLATARGLVQTFGKNKGGGAH